MVSQITILDAALPILLSTSGILSTILWGLWLIKKVIKFLKKWRKTKGVEND